MVTLSVDSSRLNTVIQNTARLLPTTVEAEIRKHTRLAAGELAKQSSPKNRQKAMAQIAFAGRKNFYPLPLPNFIGVAKKSTAGGMLWLYASPRFLVGASVKDYNLGMSLDTRAIAGVISNNRHRKGRTWEDAGKRGPQHIMIVGKPVVQPDKLEQGIRAVQSNVGKAKATWIKAAADLNLDAKADAWVLKHKNSARGIGTQEGSPQSMVFALVLTSIIPARIAARHQAMANGVMKGRAAKAAADLRNQMNGVYKKAGFH